MLICSALFTSFQPCSSEIWVNTQFHLNILHLTRLKVLPLLVLSPAYVLDSNLINTHQRPVLICELSALFLRTQVELCPLDIT